MGETLPGERIRRGSIRAGMRDLGEVGRENVGLELGSGLRGGRGLEAVRLSGLAGGTAKEQHHVRRRWRRRWWEGSMLCWVREFQKNCIGVCVRDDDGFFSLTAQRECGVAFLALFLEIGACFVLFVILRVGSEKLSGVLNNGFFFRLHLVLMDQLLNIVFC